MNNATDKTDITLNNGLTRSNGTSLTGNGNIGQIHTNQQDFSLGGISTTTSIVDMYEPKKAVDIKVVPDEFIEITYIQRAKYSYTTTINYSIGTQFQVSNPDRVFKETYACVDGKLTLVKTVQGRIIPPVLDESYEFEDEE